MDGAGAAVPGFPKGFGAELNEPGAPKGVLLAPNPVPVDAGGCTKGAREPPKPVVVCAEPKPTAPVDEPKGVDVADAQNAGALGAVPNPKVVFELPNGVADV
jgi:hypothetical protein